MKNIDDLVRSSFERFVNISNLPTGLRKCDISPFPHGVAGAPNFDDAVSKSRVYLACQRPNKRFQRSYILSNCSRNDGNTSRRAPTFRNISPAPEVGKRTKTRKSKTSFVLTSSPHNTYIPFLKTPN